MPDLDAEITPELQLRAAALAYPEAAEEFPWGERVIKVRGKIFLFLGAVEGRLRLSVKLPQSFLDALTVPGAQRLPLDSPAKDGVCFFLCVMLFH